MRIRYGCAGRADSLAYPAYGTAHEPGHEAGVLGSDAEAGRGMRVCCLFHGSAVITPSYSPAYIISRAYRPGLWVGLAMGPGGKAGERRDPSPATWARLRQ